MLTPPPPGEGWQGEVNSSGSDHSGESPTATWQNKQKGSELCLREALCMTMVTDGQANLQPTGDVLQVVQSPWTALCMCHTGRH